MSSASTIYCACAHSDCAAHDALQNRDRTKLWRFPAQSLWRSRISGAPQRRQVYAVCASLTALSPRPQIMKGPVYALALRRIRDTGRAMLTLMIAQGRLRLPPGALAALAAPPPLGPVPFDRVEGMLLGLAIGDSLGKARSISKRLLRLSEVPCALGSRRLAQQDQYRHSIGRNPHDPVLPESAAERCRGFQIDAQHKSARFGRPFPGRIGAMPWLMPQGQTNDFR